MSQYNVDYAVVKKPSQETPMSKQEADEWIKCALDPWYFFTTYCKVTTPKGLQIFNPRDYQEEILDLVINNRYSAINAPRQVGKCSGKNSKYTIRNKITGEIHEITAEQFHLKCKNR